jgi:hypothetical protein
VAEAKGRIRAVGSPEQFTGVLGGQFGPEDRKHFFQNMPHAGATDEVRLVNLSSEVIAPVAAVFAAS